MQSVRGLLHNNSRQGPLVHTLHRCRRQQAARHRIGQIKVIPTIYTSMAAAVTLILPLLFMHQRSKRLTSFRSVRMSWLLRPGCLWVLPFCRDPTMRMPLYRNISLTAPTATDVWRNSLSHGHGVVDVAITAAFFPSISGCGHAELLSSIMAYTTRANSPFRNPGILPQ